MDFKTVIYLTAKRLPFDEFKTHAYSKRDSLGQTGHPSRLG